MSGIRAFDRAQDAYNLAKKRAVQTKVIVYAVPRPKLGVFSQEFRFPYNGKVVDVYASTGKVGATATRVQVEKCSHSAYISTPVWVPVLLPSLTLDANEKSTATSSSPSTIVSADTAEDDHYRINFDSVGSGLEGFTLEIIIAI